MANYAFGMNPLPDVENGHTFFGDNFTQLNPNTSIFAGKTGLTFKNCLLTNCSPPTDSIYIGATPHNINWCTHLMPLLVERGLKVACSENCEHVVSTDSITIDGVLVGTIYHYENTVV